MKKTLDVIFNVARCYLHKTSHLALRLVVLSVFLLGTVTLIGLASQYITNEEHHVADKGLQDGWGHEALVVIGETAQSMSPVQLANACGLGASSCFKCHNGRRADKPATGALGVWHDDHAGVNYSCAGCHQGNPRILRKELAHANFLPNPVVTPEQSCTSCHGADKAKTLLANYHKIQQERGDK